MSERGQVKWFNASKGYGFISRAAGGDVFVHLNDIADREPLGSGEWVEFEVAEGRKGPKAVNVRHARAEEFVQEAPTKPYDFVPFSPQVRRDETVGHEKFYDDGNHHSGRLSYRLRALSHIFVASGAYALGEDIGLPSEDVVRGCYRVGGTPAIPGSTLKGMARSIVEAATASCITITRVNRRQLPGGDLMRGCTPDRACPACSMFGRMGRMSKVSFSDALLTEEGRTGLYQLPALYSPRAGWRRTAPVYLAAGQKLRGRKFYYHSTPRPDPRAAPVEAIAIRSELEASLDFENLTDDELGALLFALGLDNSFAPKLGGGKPVGLGSVQFLATELEQLEVSSFVQAERTVRCTGGELGDFVRGMIQGAQESGYILSKQAEELRRILNPRTEREAPVGMY